MYLASTYKRLLIKVAAFQHWFYFPHIMLAEGAQGSRYQRTKAWPEHTATEVSDSEDWNARGRSLDPTCWTCFISTAQRTWFWSALELTSMRAMKGPEFHCLTENLLPANCILLANNLETYFQLKFVPTYYIPAADYSPENAVLKKILKKYVTNESARQIHWANDDFHLFTTICQQMQPRH